MALNAGYDDQLLETGPVSRLLGLSTEHVRRLVDSGKLPAIRSASGMRLVRRADVAALAIDRARRRHLRGH